MRDPRRHPPLASRNCHSGLAARVLVTEATSSKRLVRGRYRRQAGHLPPARAAPPTTRRGVNLAPRRDHLHPSDATTRSRVDARARCSRDRHERGRAARRQRGPRVSGFVADLTGAADQEQRNAGYHEQTVSTRSSRSRTQLLAIEAAGYPHSVDPYALEPRVRNPAGSRVRLVWMETVERRADRSSASCRAARSSDAFRHRRRRRRGRDRCSSAWSLSASFPARRVDAEPSEVWASRRLRRPEFQAHPRRRPAVLRVTEDRPWTGFPGRLRPGASEPERADLRQIAICSRARPPRERSASEEEEDVPARG